MYILLVLTVLSPLRGQEFNSPKGDDYDGSVNISQNRFSPEDILTINFDDKDKQIINLIDNATPVNALDILRELRTFANLLLYCNHYYDAKDKKIMHFSANYVKKGGPKFIRKRIDSNVLSNKTDWDFCDEQNFRSLITESKVLYVKLRVKVSNCT